MSKNQSPASTETIVFIIPGYQERISSGYKKLAKTIALKKYNPILVNIRWKYATMSDYVNQFTQLVDQHGSIKFYFIGFSFGAMIAFLASITLRPQRIFLCSLSPYFKEDLKNTKESDKRSLGKKRLQDFNNFSFNKLATKIKSKTSLFVGERELSVVLSRARQAKKRIRNATLSILQNTDHQLKREKYFRSVADKL